MQAFSPKVVCFSCDFSWGYLSDHDTIAAGAENWIPVTCSSKVDATYILEAFEKGADGVLILGCPEGRCHFEDGNLRTEKKIYLLQRIIEAYGIERQRIKMIFASNPDGQQITQLIDDMKRDLVGLGPVRRG
jgi:F420-non-reducing hydrogenase iron-sulfur subunit